MLLLPPKIKEITVFEPTKYNDDSADEHNIYDSANKCDKYNDELTEIKEIAVDELPNMRRLSLINPPNVKQILMDPSLTLRNLLNWKISTNNFFDVVPQNINI